MLKRLWHLCPDPVRVLIRRLRSLLVDPSGRGVKVDISGAWVRVPAYFMGGGRAGYELESAGRFREWISGHLSGLVIDVGCSLSTYGAIALDASPDTRVIAIDPDLASLVWTRFLCSCVGAPRRLRLVHGFEVASPEPAQGIDDAAADADRKVGRHPSPFAVSTKYQDGNEAANASVPRHSIDALMDRQEAPGGLLIKVDVEGHELGVLEGALRTLRRLKPTLLLSVHPQFGVDVSRVRGFLESAGYATEHFATDHEEHWWCTTAAMRVT